MTSDGDPPIGDAAPCSPTNCDESAAATTVTQSSINRLPDVNESECHGSGSSCAGGSSISNLDSESNGSANTSSIGFSTFLNNSVVTESDLNQSDLNSEFSNMSNTDICNTDMSNTDMSIPDFVRASSVASVLSSLSDESESESLLTLDGLSVGSGVPSPGESSMRGSCQTGSEADSLLIDTEDLSWNISAGNTPQNSSINSGNSGTDASAIGESLENAIEGHHQGAEKRGFFDRSNSKEKSESSNTNSKATASSESNFKASPTNSKVSAADSTLSLTPGPITVPALSPSTTEKTPRTHTTHRNSLTAPYYQKVSDDSDCPPLTRAIVNELVDMYGIAWVEQDEDKILEIFTEDAVYKEKPGKCMKSHAEIRDYWRKQIRMKELGISFMHVESDMIFDGERNAAQVKWVANFEKVKYGERRSSLSETNSWRRGSNTGLNMTGTDSRFGSPDNSKTNSVSDLLDRKSSKASRRGSGSAEDDGAGESTKGPWPAERELLGKCSFVQVATLYFRRMQNSDKDDKYSDNTSSGTPDNKKASDLWKISSLEEYLHPFYKSRELRDFLERPDGGVRMKDNWKRVGENGEAVDESASRDNANSGGSTNHNANGGGPGGRMSTASKDSLLGRAWDDLDSAEQAAEKEAYLLRKEKEREERHKLRNQKREEKREEKRRREAGSEKAGEVEREVGKEVKSSGFTKGSEREDGNVVVTEGWTSPKKKQRRSPKKKKSPEKQEQHRQPQLHQLNRNSSSKQSDQIESWRASGNSSNYASANSGINDGWRQKADTPQKSEKTDDWDFRKRSDPAGQNHNANQRSERDLDWGRRAESRTENAADKNRSAGNRSDSNRTGADSNWRSSYREELNKEATEAYWREEIRDERNQNIHNHSSDPRKSKDNYSGSGSEAGSWRTERSSREATDVNERGSWRNQSSNHSASNARNFGTNPSATSATDRNRSGRNMDW